jgi:hypothetical protein
MTKRELLPSHPSQITLSERAFSRHSMGNIWVFHDLKTRWAYERKKREKGRRVMDPKSPRCSLVSMDESLLFWNIYFWKKERNKSLIHSGIDVTILALTSTEHSVEGKLF